MWTAVSGATAQAQKVDTIANNLANSNTDGFKKDLPTFKEYLTGLENTVNHAPDPKDIPMRPVKDEDLFPLDGKDQSHVVIDGTYTDFTQGPMKVTQKELDVALNGPGFLEVNTPQGSQFTRHGSLKISQDGKLVTSEGYAVLAATPGGLAAAQPAIGGQPNESGRLLATQGGVAVDPALNLAREISIKDRPGRITITSNGDLYVGPEKVATLSVVEFSNPQTLEKTGSQLFQNRTAINIPSQAQKTTLHQRMLEASNVNPVQEMTNLIQANRAFEQGIKAIKTYSEMMTKESNEVGKL